MMLKLRGEAKEIWKNEMEELGIIEENEDEIVVRVEPSDMHLGYFDTGDGWLVEDHYLDEVLRKIAFFCEENEDYEII